MKIKRIFAITLATTLIGSSVFAFSDIEGHWAKADIEHLQQEDIVNGYRDGSFKPNKVINREEFAMIMFKAINRDNAINPANHFSDLKEGHWSTAPINYLYELGVVKGYPHGEFAPYRLITRAEVVSIINNFVKDRGLIIRHDPSFSDIRGHWSEQEVYNLSSYGIINGYTDGTFKPEKFVTRAEVVTMITKMLKAVEEADSYNWQ